MFKVSHKYKNLLTFILLHRDCIYPVNIRETRVRVCVEALKELFFVQGFDGNDPKYLAQAFLQFYECMITLNVETIDDEFENNEVRRSGKSFSRDYEMLTIEVCFLGNSIVFHMNYNLLKLST